MLLQQGQHIKLMQQNIANHQTRVYFESSFCSSSEKGHMREKSEPANDKHGKSISTIRKGEKKQSVLDNQRKVLPLLLFYDALRTDIRLHTPTVYFCKSLQNQAASTILYIKLPSYIALFLTMWRKSDEDIAITINVTVPKYILFVLSTSLRPPKTYSLHDLRFARR
jgi:hypothetical protein